jgi:valyl-tRNA synthetase
MPFITEELWSQVGKPDYLTFDSIMFAPYPRPAEHFNDDKAAKDMNYVIRVIRAIRNIRQTYNVPASAQAPCLIECKNAEEEKTLLLAQEYLKRLARLSPLSISGKVDASKQSAYEKVGESTIYVPLNELIDVDKAKTKLTIRHDALAKELSKVTEILSNQDFKKKAPADKVQAIEVQRTDLEIQMQSVKAQMKVLELA